jgi:hypothetical protein
MTAWMDYTYSAGYRISRVHEFPFRRRVEVDECLIERAERIECEFEAIQNDLKEAWANGVPGNGEIES